MHPTSDQDYHRRVDHGLTALLVLQGLTLFVVVPLGRQWFLGWAVLDACHLGFAFICVAVLARHRLLRTVLVVSILMLTAAPLAGGAALAMLHLGATEQHETIAMVAFAFNAAVTALVARHVFTPGRVTKHRVRGAVLLYLNVAALFAIADRMVNLHSPGAFGGAGIAGTDPGASTAAFTYFSLTTITTTGFGDIVPLAPLTRSLANLEAVFGQLFPATLLARLVALHLADEARPDSREDRTRAAEPPITRDQPPDPYPAAPRAPGWGGTPRAPR